MWLALAYDRLGQKDRAFVHYDSARTHLLAVIDSFPAVLPFYSDLAITYAGVGREGEALELGRSTVDQSEDDAFWGPSHRRDFARTLTILGLHDQALDQIEYLLSIPGPGLWISPARLWLDPEWVPLRDHPRFQALLEKYADDVEH